MLKVADDERNIIIKMAKVCYKLNNITKTYPGVTALDDVSFELTEGEIHSLVGKNGAGKSTLTGIMYGSIVPTSGDIIIDDVKVEDLTPWNAKKKGIFLVPQHPEFTKDITVAENLFLGMFPKTKIGLIENKKIIEKTKEIIERLGLATSPNQLMSRVSIEEQQMLLVGKAFWVDKARIILLDEITATLSHKMREKFFALLSDSVKSEKVAVVFITHRIQEVMEISDRVTVLRDGKNIGTVNVRDTKPENIVQMITGSVSEKKIVFEENPDLDNRNCLIKLRGLSLDNIFKDISFEVKQGEIVGLAGLEGSGTTEIMKCIAGIMKHDSGEILCEGNTISFKSPKEGICNGITYLTHNREVDGIIQGCSVEHNIFGSMYRKAINALGIIKRKMCEQVSLDMKDKLSIKMPSSRSIIDTLSGGNKQKVLIARMILTEPKLFLLDHVTQGIDIEAKREVLRIIREGLSKKAAIIMSAESIEEMMEICDRIIVLFKGEIKCIIARKEFSEELIFSKMQGF